MSRIWHIDLARELPDPDDRLEHEDVFVVFWWHELPLGHTQIEARQQPLSGDAFAASVLRAIMPTLNYYADRRRRASSTVTVVATAGEPSDGTADHRQHLRAAIHRLAEMEIDSLASPTSSLIDVSVVVPTRNRPQQLVRCLRSLLNLAEKPLEIIVVDNAAGADASPSLAVVSALPGVRYLREDRPGASAARNAGIRVSCGSVVALVDDDEVVHPHWLTWIREAMSRPEIAVVTGLVLPAELDTPAQVLFEKRFSFIRGYCPQYFGASFLQLHRGRGLPVWRIGGSGNMALRREAFDQLAGFDERLGAGRSGGCEELELFYRVLKGGGTCIYEPRAVAYHFHRKSLAGVKQQLFAYSKGHVVMCLTIFSQFHDWAMLGRVVFNLPVDFARDALRYLSGRSSFDLRLIAEEIRGYLAGFKYHICNRNQ